jgi:hypothetical protein
MSLLVTHYFTDLLEDISKASYKVLDPTGFKKDDESLNKVTVLTTRSKEQSNYLGTKIIHQHFIVLRDDVVSEHKKTVRGSLLSHFITSA